MSTLDRLHPAPFIAGLAASAAAVLTIIGGALRALSTRHVERE